MTSMELCSCFRHRPTTKCEKVDLPANAEKIARLSLQDMPVFYFLNNSVFTFLISSNAGSQPDA